MSSSNPRQGSVLHPRGIAVVVESEEDRLVEESRQLIHLLGDSEENPHHILYFGKRGIELKTPEHIHHNGKRVDFSSIDFRTGAGNLSKNQPLPKAIGEHTTLVDATAGFGMDAARLAMMGYHVIAIEQSPIISAMLRDGLWRAEQNTEVREALGGRLTIIESNSTQHLQNIQCVEVVYIDPMFPPKRKKSALPPGHIQVLQSVVGYDNPEQTRLLFEVALTAATRRVVVKRPMRAPPMSTNPIATHNGKLVRYEVYRPTPHTKREVKNREQL
jgi:16S rRNA (guanine1516-N2)-methyltransferase